MFLRQCSTVPTQRKHLLCTRFLHGGTVECKAASGPRALFKRGCGAKMATVGDLLHRLKRD